MKIILFFLLPLVLNPSFADAQTLFDVNFSGGYPPTGWTIDAQPGNWSAVNSNQAGGVAPELRLNWTPQFNGSTRFISPATNTTGYTTIALKFKYYLDHYDGPYTIGVATRSNNGTWNTVWSITNPSISSQAEETVFLANSNVGTLDFQVCFFFSGSSYNLNYWFIDDVKLFVPLAHDVMVKDILTQPEYVPNISFTPQALVKNFGLNPETFNATCTIKLNGSAVYTQNSTNIAVTSGAEQTLTFPDFNPTAVNDLYEITVKTNLAGDMDPSNDTRTEGFDTYTTPRKMVILEIGTGTWCQYCPGASMGAHDLITNGKAVGVVKYHNGDSFTNSYSNARNSYYAVPGYPTAIFDGVQYVVGGSNTVSMYPTYLPIYESRKVKNCAFDLKIYGQNTGLNYSITIRVEKMANIPASYNNLVLHLALTESDIPFNWQGQTMVNNAERLMVPNENGTALIFSSSNVVDINLNFSMNSSWLTNNCELVSFIQNLDGKEILQGTKIALTNLAPVPVELTSFAANYSSGTAILEWTTATEINNSGFEIERSFDGKAFYAIGFVKGNGTTTEPNSYTFSDELTLNGVQTIYYRLKQVDYDGAFEFSKTIEVNVLPTVYSLEQNYPNPFNPSTKINFNLAADSKVTLKVFNLLGEEVRTLINGNLLAGSHKVDFNASNLNTGVYIYKLEAVGIDGSIYNNVKKMTLIK